MWTPFKAQREFQKESLQAMKEMSVAQSKALEAIAVALTAYLQSFKVEGSPRGWTMDDRAEALQERERLASDPSVLMPPAPPSLEIQRLQFMLHDLDS